MADWNVKWRGHPISLPSYGMPYLSDRQDIEFDNIKYTVLEGMQGWGLSPTTLNIRGFGGSEWRHTQTRKLPREMDLIVLVQASNSSLLEDYIGDLMYAVSPLRGEGALIITNNYRSTPLVLFGYLKSGATGSTGRDEYGAYWARMLLTFTFPDPYWRDLWSTPLVYSTAIPSMFFPILPITLIPGGILTTEIITNTGDVEFWPVWTFSGPGTSPGVQNVTTGKSFLFTGLDIPLGQDLVINTAPGYKTAVLNGVNVFSELDPGSSLFSIEPGDNEINIAFTDVAAYSTVIMLYYKRYLSL